MTKVLFPVPWFPACPFTPGFSKVLKSLTADSTRDELLSFIQQYGSHYVSEALYGSELSCNIYFPSKKVQQQLWLQYQKGELKGEDDGGSFSLKSTVALRFYNTTVKNRNRLKTSHVNFFFLFPFFKTILFYYLFLKCLSFCSRWEFLFFIIIILKNEFVQTFRLILFFWSQVRTFYFFIYFTLKRHTVSFGPR